MGKGSLGPRGDDGRKRQPRRAGLSQGKLQVERHLLFPLLHDDRGFAAAYGVTLLALTSIGVYFQSRLSASGHRYSTVTGKGFRPRRIDLGRWRCLTAAIFIVYFLLIVA